jgi:isopenicillin N synthase-like dioxygenase
MQGTAELNQADPVVGFVDQSYPTFAAADILGNRSDELVAAIRAACLETGFFCIEPAAQQSSGIPTALQRMQDFFAIDDQDPCKQNVRQDDSRRGWRPRYTEPAYQPGTVASLEAFDFGVDELNDSQFWPAVNGFREASSACWNEYVQLADGALELLALAAGLEPGFFASRCDSRSLNSMRLLHYAGDLPATDANNVGIAAHTDFECITLLYQSAPGLELRDVNGDWLDAAGSGDRIVVMLDDMLERWTNGYFKATGHRVRETDQQRFSIVLFVAANEDETIAPLAQFVSDDTPARYQPVTQAQHLADEIRRAQKNSDELVG